MKRIFAFLFVFLFVSASAFAYQTFDKYKNNSIGFIRDMIASGAFPVEKADNSGIGEKLKELARRANDVASALPIDDYQYTTDVEVNYKDSNYKEHFLWVDNNPYPVGSAFIAIMEINGYPTVFRNIVVVEDTDDFKTYNISFIKEDGSIGVQNINSKLVKFFVHPKLANIYSVLNKVTGNTVSNDNDEFFGQEFKYFRKAVEAASIPDAKNRITLKSMVPERDYGDSSSKSKSFSAEEKFNERATEADMISMYAIESINEFIESEFSDISYVNVGDDPYTMENVIVSVNGVKNLPRLYLGGSSVHHDSSPYVAVVRTAKTADGLREYEIVATGVIEFFFNNKTGVNTAFYIDKDGKVKAIACDYIYKNDSVTPPFYHVIDLARETIDKITFATEYANRITGY